MIEDDATFPGEENTCLCCGDPLPVDALSNGVEFCSTECKDEHLEAEE